MNLQTLYRTDTCTNITILNPYLSKWIALFHSLFFHLVFLNKNKSNLSLFQILSFQGVTKRVLRWHCHQQNVSLLTLGISINLIEKLFLKPIHRHLIDSGSWWHGQTIFFVIFLNIFVQSCWTFLDFQLNFSSKRDFSWDHRLASGF